MLQNPGVLQHVRERDSVCGIALQQTHDQILRLGADAKLRGEFDIRLDNVLQHVLHVEVVGHERRRAREEFVRENAQAPDIDALVVSVALQHLWWQIIQGAQQCSAYDRAS